MNFVRRAEGETGEEICFCDHLRPFANARVLEEHSSSPTELPLPKVEKETSP